MVCLGFEPWAAEWYAQTKAWWLPHLILLC